MQGKKPRQEKLGSGVKNTLQGNLFERMQTDYAQRMMKLRQCAVEPVIGTLVNYTGIGRVYTHGLHWLINV